MEPLPDELTPVASTVWQRSPSWRLLDDERRRVVVAARGDQLVLNGPHNQVVAGRLTGLTYRQGRRLVRRVEVPTNRRHSAAIAFEAFAMVREHSGI